jgi:hypothetical protein
MMTKTITKTMPDSMTDSMTDTAAMTDAFTDTVKELLHRNMYYMTLCAMYKDITVTSLRTKWLMTGEWKIKELSDNMMSWKMSAPIMSVQRSLIKDITTTLSTKYSIHTIVWYVDGSTNYDGNMHMLYICMEGDKKSVTEVINSKISKYADA